LFVHLATYIEAGSVGDAGGALAHRDMSQRTRAQRSDSCDAAALVSAWGAPFGPCCGQAQQPGNVLITQSASCVHVFLDAVVVGVALDASTGLETGGSPTTAVAGALGGTAVGAAAIVVEVDGVAAGVASLLGVHDAITTRTLAVSTEPQTHDFMRRASTTARAAQRRESS